MFKRLPFLIFLIVYFIFVLLTYKDYGVAIDEPLEYRFGEMLYARNFGNDPQLIKDFAYENENSREIWAYNHFHTMLLYIINDAKDLNIYHLLNFAFAVVGFYVAYEFALGITLNPFLSLLAPVMLLLMPRFFGDIAANVKDPVFAIYFVFSLLIIFVSEKINNIFIRTLIIGVSIGLAAASRFVGYSLIPVYLIYRFGTNSKNFWKSPKSFGRLFIELILILAVSIFVHGVQMPFVAANPINNLIRLSSIAKDYPWQGSMHYLGNTISSTSLPWHYLLVWISVTTPLFILVFWLLSNFYNKQKIFALINISIWQKTY